MQKQQFGIMDEGYFVPKSQILQWINQLLKISITKIEALGSGAIYCQLFDVIHPGKIPLAKVNWKAKNDNQFLANFRFLQSAFEKTGIKRYIEVQKLVKAKYQDNLEFIQWFKRYFDLNCGSKGEGYDAVQKRNKIVPDFGFSDKTVVPKVYNSGGQISTKQKQKILSPHKKKQQQKKDHLTQRPQTATKGTGKPNTTPNRTITQVHEKKEQGKKVETKKQQNLKKIEAKKVQPVKKVEAKKQQSSKKYEPKKQQISKKVETKKQQPKKVDVKKQQSKKRITQPPKKSQTVHHAPIQSGPVPTRQSQKLQKPLIKETDKRVKQLQQQLQKIRGIIISGDSSDKKVEAIGDLLNMNKQENIETLNHVENQSQVHQQQLTNQQQKTEENNEVLVNTSQNKEEKLVEKDKEKQLLDNEETNTQQQRTEQHHEHSQNDHQQEDLNEHQHEKQHQNEQKQQELIHSETPIESDPPINSSDKQQEHSAENHQNENIPEPQTPQSHNELEEKPDVTQQENEDDVI